jgi:tellurite resistance protein
MAKKQPDAKSALAILQAHAESIRKDLNVPKQSDVFRAAVEAAYLTALADGEVDAEERATMVRAIELLSHGLVIEWEADTLVEQCAERARTNGPEARAAAVGRELAALGQSEAGLFVAALVARASKGIDKSEAEVLKAVGAAAGIATEKVRDIVKKAFSLGGEAAAD